MQKVSKRKLITVGGSVGITLPAKFLKESQLKVGDQMAVVFDDVLFYLKPIEPKEPK
jgi:antitoxin component of MazEF toxin-antitoxin module